MDTDDLNTTEIDRIIHFLEYEINISHAQEKLPGWSTWAISGAIASLTWLMFSVLESSKSISLDNILYISLFTAYLLN